MQEKRELGDKSIEKMLILFNHIIDGNNNDAQYQLIEHSEIKIRVTLRLQKTEQEILFLKSQILELQRQLGSIK